MLRGPHVSSLISLIVTTQDIGLLNTAGIILSEQTGVPPDHISIEQTRFRSEESAEVASLLFRYDTADIGILVPSRREDGARLLYVGGGSKEIAVIGASQAAADGISVAIFSKVVGLGDVSEYAKVLVRQSPVPPEFREILDGSIIVLHGVLNKNFEDLELSVRLANILRHENKHSIGDIVVETDNGFLKLWNSSRKSLKEMKALLEKHGSEAGIDIHLGMSPEELRGWKKPTPS